MRQSTLYAFIMLGILLCAVIAAGCTDSITKPIHKPAGTIPDPETGIAAWIVAVNERNFGGVYDLLPVSKRAGMTKEDFIKFNQENPSPFLASGPVINDFFVMEKKVDGLNATIFAGLQTQRTIAAQNSSNAAVTVYFTFHETYEDYEWKVWTS